MFPLIVKINILYNLIATHSASISYIFDRLLVHNNFNTHFYASMIMKVPRFKISSEFKLQSLSMALIIVIGTMQESGG
jgi:hypothetical protein